MRLLACLLGVKKTFSMIFYFRAHWSKKHGLGQDQKSKNIASFRVQRSKKHSLWFSRFVPIGRKNMVLFEIKSQKTLFPSGFKGQKNILYDFLDLCLLVEKTLSWSRSKVKKHCFVPGSKVKTTFSISRLSIEKIWTVLVQRSTVEKWSEVLGWRSPYRLVLLSNTDWKWCCSIWLKIWTRHPVPRVTDSDKRWKDGGDHSLDCR
jgi:hypothetical protein